MSTTFVCDSSYIRVESFVLALFFFVVVVFVVFFVLFLFFHAFFYQLHKLRPNCDNLCIYFDIASNYRP